jgi:hypothetical protein
MGHPTSSSLRLEIIKARQEDQLSYRSLAVRYKVSYQTARHICLCYAQQGQSALVADYSTCGRGISPAAQKAYRLVRIIAHYHPTWGVGYILTRIRIVYPDLSLQSERTYQRRLKKDCPKVDVPPAKIPRASLHNDVRQAHDEWQIDAKEQIKLVHDQRVCYLNITDTKSHALLKAKLFPPVFD